MRGAPEVEGHAREVTAARLRVAHHSVEHVPVETLTGDAYHPGEKVREKERTRNNHRREL